MAYPIFTYELHGFKELKEELLKLPKKIEQQLIRKALKKSAQILLAEVKKNLQGLNFVYVNETGEFQRSKHSRKYGTIESNLKIKTAAKKLNTIGFEITTGDAFWARYIEYGWLHASGYKREYGKHLRKTRYGRMRRYGQKKHGEIPARPFMRPAFWAKRKEILSYFESELKKITEKKLTKLNKAA